MIEIALDIGTTKICALFALTAARRFAPLGEARKIIRYRAEAGTVGVTL